MSYFGAAPTGNFITTASQRVTSSTNNYVDLDHAISALSDVIVLVNSVKQDITNLTFTSASRITLGGTLVSSDVVEIIYLGKSVATQTPGTATVTNDMLAGSIANAKLANSSITLNGSAVSLGGSATVGGTNEVMFSAYQNGDTTVNHEVVTKLEFDAEIFDVGSCFDTSNYRFTVPTGKGGYYQLGYSVNYESSSNGTALIGWTKVYKNGSRDSTGTRAFEYYQNNTGNPLRNVQTAKSFLMNLSAGDYIELYGQIAHNSSSSMSARTSYSHFYGYKLIT